MKTRIDFYSSKNLGNFLSNLDMYFELQIKSFEEFESHYNKKNLSVLFLDNHNKMFEQTIKIISKDENFILVSKDFSLLKKFSVNEKNLLTPPFSMNKLLDILKNFANSKKHIFENCEIHNNTIRNTKNNKTVYLTQAENHILLKLFREKQVKKKHLERDVLEIKNNLNTSSIESHLNRIRKKLKEISSNLTIASKDGYVSFDIVSLNR